MVGSLPEVVHVITSLEVGGAQRMLVKLLERPGGSAFRHRVVSLIDGGEFGPRLESLGVEVRGLGMRSGVPDPRAAVRLWRLLRRWRPAILQTWLYHADLLGAIVARSAGARRLVWNLRCSIHDEEHRSFAARLAPRLCAWGSRLPDVVMINSNNARATHERIGYRPRRWEYVPNGFDLDAFRPDAGARVDLRAELGLAEDAVLGGMVARWDPVKDHELVLRASERLRERVPELHLVFAGPGVEPDGSPFAELHARLGARDRVHALGPRTDVPRVMAGLDFLVSASRFEGFPNVLGEALACATPCVTTRAGDCAEVVGDAGFAVDVGDLDGLCDAVERMVRLGADERASLGRRGRERVSREFGLDAVARRYEDLYRELAGV